jgi:hypothetical protein
MTHLPLAFSIHHFISSVGADAGFASIIGLAILVLLYFAQARETATLRERADGAEQRSAQLEARLSQLAQAARAPAPAQPAGPRPVPSPIARPLANPTPAASPAVAATAAAPGNAVAIPAAPAGVGAPALSAAKKLISLPAGGGAPVQPKADPAVAQPDPTPEPVAASGPAPATAAGASATATASATALATPPAPPVPVETGNGSGGDTSGQPLFDAEDHDPPRRVQLRTSGGGARQMPPLRQAPSSRGPSRFGRGVAVLVAALGVAVVIAVLLIVTSGGGGKNKPSGGTSTSNAPSATHKSKTKGFNKRAVTVTVLNGTGTAGLAAHILTQLSNAGFKQGTATNAENATQTTSLVSYVQGQKAAAQQVAKALKLGAGTVSPIDPTTQSIACPQTTCNVDVVVTVGLDLVGR